MANHIFISYSREDSDFAEDLKEKLEAADFEVWTDKSRLIPGEDWRESIDQAIRDALALIVVMTPTAEASKYVTYEWAFAWGIGVKIIPILFEPNTPLHPRLGTLEYLNFTHRTKYPWDDLINPIRKLPKKDPVIQDAIAKLDSSNKNDRENAIDTLVESKHQEALKALIWASTDHTLLPMRRAVAQALERIADAAVPALIEALGNQPLSVRQGAAEVLGRIRDAKELERIEGPQRFMSRLRRAIRSATNRT